MSHMLRKQTSARSQFCSRSAACKQLRCVCDFRRCPSVRLEARPFPDSADGDAQPGREVDAAQCMLAVVAPHCALFGRCALLFQHRRLRRMNGEGVVGPSRSGLVSLGDGRGLCGRGLVLRLDRWLPGARASLRVALHQADISPPGLPKGLFHRARTHCMRWLLPGMRDRGDA